MGLLSLLELGHQLLQELESFLVGDVLESSSLGDLHELKLVDVEIGDESIEERNEFLALIEDGVVREGDKLVSDLVPHLLSVVILDRVDLFGVGAVGGFQLVEDLEDA